jgi:uncharacterized protein YndB with AHSA1/START domain/DNA-binding transcriptional ArsR family regulator
MPHEVGLGLTSDYLVTYRRGVDDEVFRALADPSRRTLLDRLFERDGQTLGDLESALPSMSRFGVMKHLRVLEAANLVTSRKVGRERHHYLNPVPIRQLHDRWLDRYRIRAADLLDDLRFSLETDAMTMSAETTQPTASVPPDHVVTTFIKAKPDTVWRALTESDFTVKYYYRSTVESDWRAGSRYRYAIDGETAIEGEIVEADRPRRLVMTFSAVWDPAVAADAPTRLTWELEDAAPGVTRLTVVHGGFEGETETFRQVTGGWSWILAGLKSLLETGEALPRRA